MHFGYEYSDDPDTPSTWGKGSPVKVGLTVVFDHIAFWRIVPHKHIPSKYDTPNWPPGQVNSQCDRCYRWFALATGKLDNRFNL
jgi:hypothetical protein